MYFDKRILQFVLDLKFFSISKTVFNPSLDESALKDMLFLQKNMIGDSETDLKDYEAIIKKTQFKFNRNIDSLVPKVTQTAINIACDELSGIEPKKPIYDPEDKTDSNDLPDVEFFLDSHTTNDVKIHATILHAEALASNLFQGGDEDEFSDRLSKLKIYETGSDSDCLYNSISLSLNIMFKGGDPASWLNTRRLDPTLEDGKFTAKKLRTLFADNITDGELDHFLKLDKKRIKPYLHLMNIGNPNRWKDQNSLFRMRRLLKTNMIPGDVSTINVFERIFNIKFITLKSTMNGKYIIDDNGTKSGRFPSNENMLCTLLFNVNEYHYKAFFAGSTFFFNFEDIPEYIMFLIFKDLWLKTSSIDKSNEWYYENDQFRKYLTFMEGRYKKLGTPTPSPVTTPIKSVRSPTNPGHIRFDMSGGDKFNKNVYSKLNKKGDVLNENDGSKLSYYVIVDIELYPGEEIPKDKRNAIACEIKYEKIRKAYADTFGVLYQPKEMYSPLSPTNIMNSKTPQKTLKKVYPTTNPNLTKTKRLMTA
jgi:hypothetical protein